MRRSTLARAVAFVMAAVGASAARAASTLCVGSKPGCYSTIQTAVDAAHDGDTITIAPGTYTGGLTIDVSVNVVGPGAGETIPTLTLELSPTALPAVRGNGQAMMRRDDLTTNWWVGAGGAHSATERQRVDARLAGRRWRVGNGRKTSLSGGALPL